MVPPPPREVGPVQVGQHRGGGGQLWGGAKFAVPGHRLKRPHRFAFFRGGEIDIGGPRKIAGKMREIAVDFCPPGLRKIPDSPASSECHVDTPPYSTAIQQAAHKGVVTETGLEPV